MEECPNCGHVDMMWGSEDSDGLIWYYCLNDGCVDLHPPVDEQEGDLLVDAEDEAGEEE